MCIEDMKQQITDLIDQVDSQIEAPDYSIPVSEREIRRMVVEACAVLCTNPNNPDIRVAIEIFPHRHWMDACTVSLADRHVMFTPEGKRFAVITSPRNHVKKINNKGKENNE